MVEKVIKNATKNELGAVIRFGHAQHGLCQNGQVTLPNTEIFSQLQPSYGTALEVRVPGIIPLDINDSDLEKYRTYGLEFRNYALLSGGNHQIYGGKDLGADSWIYIDGNKNPWLMKLKTATLNWDSVQGVVGSFYHYTNTNVEVEIRRFGTFPNLYDPTFKVKTVTAITPTSGFEGVNIPGAPEGNIPIEGLFLPSTTIRTVSKSGKKATFWITSINTLNGFFSFDASRPECPLPFLIYEIVVNGNGSLEKETFGEGISISVSVVTHINDSWLEGGVKSYSQTINTYSSHALAAGTITEESYYPSGRISSTKVTAVVNEVSSIGGLIVDGFYRGYPDPISGVPLVTYDSVTVYGNNTVGASYNDNEELVLHKFKYTYNEKILPNATSGGGTGERIVTYDDTDEHNVISDTGEISWYFSNNHSVELTGRGELYIGDTLIDSIASTYTRVNNDTYLPISYPIQDNNNYTFYGTHSFITQDVDNTSFSVSNSGPYGNITLYQGEILISYGNGSVATRISISPFTTDYNSCSLRVIKGTLVSETFSDPLLITLKYIKVVSRYLGAAETIDNTKLEWELGETVFNKLTFLGYWRSLLTIPYSTYQPVTRTFSRNKDSPVCWV